jgi:hypothetical protein
MKKQQHFWEDTSLVTSLRGNSKCDEGSLLQATKISGKMRTIPV